MMAGYLKQITPALAALALTAGAAFAQERSASSDTAALPAVAGISVQFGQVGLQSGPMNVELAAQGRGQLKKSMYTLSVESWVRWNRLMLMAESHTYLPTRAPATNYTTETSGGYGMINLGVPVILARRTLVYPMAGVGISNTTVNLRRNGAVNFDTAFRNIPSNGGRNIDITARRYQAHAGIGAEQAFLAPWFVTTVGLRAGYVQPLGDTKWRSGPEDVVGAPELGVKGAYVRLTIGGVLGKRRHAIVPMIGAILPHIGN